MVDAGAAPEDRSLARQRAHGDGRTAAETIQTTVYPAGEATLAAYAVACADAVFAPPQSPLWIGCWTKAGNPDHFAAILRRDGRPEMALALEVEAIGPFRLARFIGGSHANGNFPASSGEAISPAMLGQLVGEIRRSRPDLDMLALERQLPALDGVANPLAILPHRPGADVALAADLSGGFEALLSRVNGKRKRKKHRAQLRKFGEAGGFRRFQARDAREVDALLDAFFALKRKRFAAQGIADVFAPANVQAAFRGLFTEALRAPSPAFVLHGLEIGGRIRAVAGSSIAGRRVVCDFCAFSDDELAATSPGDFLFFETIREACEQGMAVYDFSVGEERYKREWCDIETRPFDLLLPLTAKGRLLAHAYSALMAAKRTVKEKPALWQLAKRLRQLMAR